jgi:drug/metabolite transporter (DMT)-like permease
MDPNPSSRLTAYGLLGLLALIWGSSFILMKRGLVYLGPTEVAALRVSVAMLALLPVSLRSIGVLRKHAPALFLNGLFGTILPAFLFALAQTEIPSSLSGMLNSLTSLFTLVLGIAFFRLKARANQFAGVALALLGTAGLIGFDNLAGLSIHGRYSLLVVAAAACYGTSVNLIKTYLHDVRAPQIAALSFLLTAPAATVYLLAFTDFTAQLRSEPASWWGVLWIGLLALLATSFAVILFNVLVKITTAVFAASVTYLIPVVAVAWGIADGESVGAGQLAYLALILGGIFLINKRTRASVEAVRPSGHP